MYRDKKYQYCLFDLDGTLTDSAIGYTNAIIYSLDKYDIHVPDRSELYPLIGLPLADAFMEFFNFTERQATQAVEYYREYLRCGGMFENKLYDGIVEMLEELRNRDITIALATSKSYGFSIQIVKHFNLYPYFSHIGTATMDGRINRKADVISNLLNQLGDIDRSTVLMIGDRDQDVMGAKANGLQSVGVLWGYGSKEELQNAGADFLIDKPAGILALIS